MNELNNEQIAAMAAWTLENIQDDPLAAVERVRELATAYQSMKRERDAAVRDIVEAMETELPDCVLTHLCWFCDFYDSDDCPLEKDGECIPKWRGPQKEVG